MTYFISFEYFFLPVKCYTEFSNDKINADNQMN